MVNTNNIKIELALILLGSFLAIHSFSQDTVYIDPSISDNASENGTIEHPFNSWNDLHWNDTSYMNRKVFLQKCGTEFKINNGGGYKLKKALDVVFGSYGEGEKPVLKSLENGHIFDFNNCNKIILHNLKIQGDTNIKGVAYSVSCIRFFGKYELSNENNVVIDDCDFSFAIWGLRFLYGSEAIVRNCRIHHVEDDGIFAESWSYLKVIDNRIYDVNQKWFHKGHSNNEAPGDCIQLSKRSGNFLVRGNYLDRSMTGNKFCFIHTGEPAFGVVEGNVLISPSSAGDGGACLFFGSGDSILVRNNMFQGGLQGIYSHGRVFVYYNIFDNMLLAVTNVNDSGVIINNIFYYCKTAIKGKSVIENNIFYGCDMHFDVPSNMSRKDFNCYTSTNYLIGENSIVADPQFTNPENGDFHLKGTSPCIDKGTDVGLKFDFDGAPVPRGNGVDIGAFEAK